MGVDIDHGDWGLSMRSARLLAGLMLGIIAFQLVLNAGLWLVSYFVEEGAPDMLDHVIWPARFLTLGINLILLIGTATAHSSHSEEQKALVKRYGGAWKAMWSRDFRREAKALSMPHIPAWLTPACVSLTLLISLLAFLSLLNVIPHP